MEGSSSPVKSHHQVRTCQTDEAVILVSELHGVGSHHIISLV